MREAVGVTDAPPRYSGADDDVYDIAISAAKGKNPLHWLRRLTTWSEFVSTWTTKISDEKECGGWVAGRLLRAEDKCDEDNDACNRVHRRKDTIEYRSLITLDADEVDDDFVDRVKEQGWSGLVHTSYSHGLEGKGNRYRVILRVSRAMTPEEYVAVCLWVIHRLGGVDQWHDWSTWQPERFMHRPSAPDGEGFQSWVLEGNLIDVDCAVMLAPPEPKRLRDRASYSGPVYDGPGYDELEDWQREEADEAAAKAVNRLRSQVEAFLHEGVDGDQYAGWDDRLKDAAYRLACIALQPWNAFDEDAAREAYGAILESAGEEGNPRFTEKIDYEPLWEKAAAAPVSRPPWEIEAGPTAAESFAALGGAEGEAGADEDPSWLLGGQPGSGAGAGEGGGAASEPSEGAGSGGAGAGAGGADPAALGGPEGVWTTAAPSAPMKVSRDIKRFYRGGLRYWRGDWWRWAGASWYIYEVEQLRKNLYFWLDDAVWQKRSADGNTMQVDWNPAPASVSAVVDALKARLLLGEQHEMPCWLDLVDRGAGPWVACRNGVLRLKDRALLANDGKFFNAFAVPFEYNDDAPEPVMWLRFLEQVLPDEDQRLLLQQWFGYVLSGRTDLEKALLIVGPKRAGKGTIATVLQALVGAPSCAAPNMTSLAGDFGMQSLISARLATMGDVRLGDRANHGPLERLLGIIGNDLQEVNRKNKTAWSGYLRTVFLLMSNEIPHFDDPSGAIVSRFEILHLRRSFAGQEDTMLKTRLMDELPGIFKWALDGLDSLGDGKLVQPTSSRDIAEEFHDSASPITVWAREECVFAGVDDDPDTAAKASGAWTITGDLHDSYREWLMIRGDRPVNRVHFGRQLQAAALPGVHPHKKDGKPGYRGIRLRVDPAGSPEEAAAQVFAAAQQS